MSFLSIKWLFLSVPCKWCCFIVWNIMLPFFDFVAHLIWNKTLFYFMHVSLIYIIFLEEWYKNYVEFWVNYKKNITGLNISVDIISFCILQHVVGWFMLFNTTFNNNIMEVSFIGGGKRSTVPENHRLVT